MSTTFKICNYRNCLHEEFEKCPHNAVDPCRVFRHSETNNWYDEVTGESVRVFKTQDGSFFDTQEWLESQLLKAVTVWSRRKPVHEKWRIFLPKQTASRPAAKAPKYTSKELDHIGDSFIRNKHERSQIISEIRDLGKELSGYERMTKKWGGNPILRAKIDEIREERDALRVIQSDMDVGAQTATSYLNENDKWNSRWIPTRGCWTEFVLICEQNNKLWTIDQNGLKCDGFYVYLPEMDKSYIDSAKYALTHFKISTKQWKKLHIPEERIGGAIRRHGKKNANGRRIKARNDQIKYAEEVHDIITAMRNMHISTFKVARDNDLYQYYLEKIAPKLSK